MGVLRSIAIAALAACYSPEIPECARTGACVAPDATPATPPDALPLDASPDARPMVTLSVRIDGRGDVTIPTVGTCSAGNGSTSCPFVVEKGVTLSLGAAPKNGWELDRWEDACANTSGPTCMVTPIAPTTSVRVRFSED